MNTVTPPRNLAESIRHLTPIKNELTGEYAHPWIHPHVVHTATRIGPLKSQFMFVDGSFMLIVGSQKGYTIKTKVSIIDKYRS